MFAKLTTKMALKKAGIPSSFSIPTFATSSPETTSSSTKSTTSTQKPNGTEDSILLPFTNPFTNVTIPKVWNTWATPTPPKNEIASARPGVGSSALALGSETRTKLRIGDDGRECLVVFLRWCGCPFAEKTFLTLRALANRQPRLRCIAVSHCTSAATQKWINALGGAWNVEIVCDTERALYAEWGLGLSNGYYLLNPWTQLAQRKLGTEEGIWVREIGSEGGCRWQIGGAWAVDELGIVRWGKEARTADEMVDLAEGARVVSGR